MPAIARESGWSPVAVLVHVLAIALGAFLGLRAMDAIAPNLPAEGETPGVSSSVAPRTVSGGDADSLLRADVLVPALERLDEQLAAGERLSTFLLLPGKIEAEAEDGGISLDPSEIPATAPERIVPQIAAPRRAAGGDRTAIGLDQVLTMQILARPEGPRWQVTLVPEIDPPRTATATLDGSRVTVP